MLLQPTQVTVIVTKVFDSLNIPYFVGGSLASAVHGFVRATQDVDIVAGIEPEHIQPMISLLKDSFYLDEDIIRNGVAHKSSFNIIHLDTMFKVDVFLLKERPFDKNQMERRVLQTLGMEQTESVYVSTAEDIILAKLEWYRDGGQVSERQWRDVLGILRFQTDRIKFDDLRKWAKEIGVSDLLERALQEAKEA